MDSSMVGQLNIMAAANVDTEMVFPNLLGVEIRTSWLRLDHPFISRSVVWARAKLPGGSRLKKILLHARMYCSWNCFWWYDRCHPHRSSANRAC